jgi:predicted transcriptional regulator
MFTKTSANIMKVFASRIGDSFSINQIADTLKKPYPLIHRSMQKLIEDGLISKDKRKLLSLNYRENISELAYIESLRKNEYLKKHKTAELVYNDVLNAITKDSFILLVFGSSVNTAKAGDIDILLIVDKRTDVESTEKILRGIAGNLSTKFDIGVISVDSVYEMLAKREQLNVMNETLNKHVILFGAENYYRLLTNARQ